MSKRHFLALATLTMLWPAAASLKSAAEENTIVLASTTSTQDSGLFDYLLPIVRRKTGIVVKVVAQGTGQALDTARHGDADVVLVHAREQELKFVAEGESLRRYPVMYNDFVLIGPKDDPAGVSGVRDITKALRRIMEKRASFISRGDRSGTHLAELALWKDAGIDIDRVKGPWYKSIGQGMGAALNTAEASDSYVLADRATWIHFGNKGRLRIAVEGDPRLFNQYGLMLVNPARHPNARKAAGQRFIDYLISPEGQKDIGDYRMGGIQLFHPNANQPGA
jgi:tungstate transport system substrate-binding protein